MATVTGAPSSRNFSEHEEWRRHQPGDAATRPHRITDETLTRQES